MKKKIKHIISIVLLVIFLIPIIVKGIDFTFHHHEENSCNSKNEKHFHSHEDDCFITSFTLSNFIAYTETKIQFLKSIHFVSKQKIWTFLFSKKHVYTFLLRGPPAKMILYHYDIQNSQ